MAVLLIEVSPILEVDAELFLNYCMLYLFM